MYLVRINSLFLKLPRSLAITHAKAMIITILYVRYKIHTCKNYDPLLYDPVCCYLGYHVKSDQKINSLLCFSQKG